MKKINKKSFLAIVPVLGFLGLSASAFASSSGTATFSVTTPTPTLGVTITAPSALASSSATIATSTFAPDLPVVQGELLAVSNAGNENEALNLSVGASSVTGTGSNVINLSTGNNLGVTTSNNTINNENFYNATSPATATPLPANSFSAMVGDTAGVTTIATGGGFWDLSTTNTDFGSSNTTTGISNFSSIMNTSAGANFGGSYGVPIIFAFGQGTAGDTYSIPINVAVSST